MSMSMAPRAGFDTEQVHDKARKDLLHLLEGVSQPSCTRCIPAQGSCVAAEPPRLTGSAPLPRFAARRTS